MLDQLQRAIQAGLAALALTTPLGVGVAAAQAPGPLPPSPISPDAPVRQFINNGPPPDGRLAGEDVQQIAVPPPGDVIFVGDPANGPQCSARLGGPLPDGAPPIRVQMPPVSYDDATARLAQTLALPPDQVRGALQQLAPAVPDPPRPDDIVNRVAQALGLPADRVRQALTGPGGCGLALPLEGPPGAPSSANTAEATNRLAQTLGVPPDRLRAALRQVAPPADLPRADDLVNRLAQSLGVTPDRLRAALQQLTPGGQGIVIPLPPLAGGQDAGRVIFEAPAPAPR